MKAEKLVERLLEADDPDALSAKSELMGLPGWRERIEKEETFHYLSTRWGEDLEAGIDLPTITSRPEEKLIIERLQLCLGRFENNFIVQRKTDGKYGILFEIEIENPEGEAEMEDDNLYLKAQKEAGITADSVAQELVHVLNRLEKQFPQAEFSLTTGPHVLGRFAVRAFLPVESASPELGQELSQVFSIL